MRNVDILLDATDEILKEYAPNGTFPNSTNAFLVDTPDKTILIDAGLGKKLFENLEALNCAPEEVNVILLTHMHGDHIGGLVRDGKVLFPEAELYVSQPEYDYWMSDARMEQEPNRKRGFEAARNVFKLYENKLHLFKPAEIDAERTTLFPGIYAYAAYGHTPGHVAFLLESDDERMFIWGDLTHAMVVQMPHPEVAVTYDHDPRQAVEYRNKLLPWIYENGMRVAGMHIEFPGVGGILPQPQGGYEFVPLCTCEGW